MIKKQLRGLGTQDKPVAAIAAAKNQLVKLVYLQYCLLIACLRKIKLTKQFAITITQAFSLLLVTASTGRNRCQDTGLFPKYKTLLEIATDTSLFNRD